MKIMKFALHMHNKKDITNMYELVKQAGLPYEMISSEHVQKSVNSYLHRNFFEVEPLEFGSLKPVLTSKGICRAWMPYAIEYPFQSSNFTKYFDEIFDKNITLASAEILESRNTFAFIGYESNYISNIQKASYR